MHQQFAELGAPVGSLARTAHALLFDEQTGSVLSFIRFCSAEMMTLRYHANGVIPNLQLKQAEKIAMLSPLLLGFSTLWA
ncbi:MAG: hypothetical protein R2865_05720 [Deinococcales bacterium]